MKETLDIGDIYEVDQDNRVLRAGVPHAEAFPVGANVTMSAFDHRRAVLSVVAGRRYVGVIGAKAS
jgi:hypothetical protein